MNATHAPLSSNPNLIVLKPIVCLQTAAAILGPEFGAEHVLRDIKRGPLDPQRIEWAWDISRTRCDVGREVRVLASCVPMSQRTRSCSFDEVLNLIFGDLLPGDATPNRHINRLFTVPASVLARRFACGEKHVLSLAKTRALAEVPHSRRRGRTGSPAITWQSIVQFLTERRFQ